MIKAIKSRNAAGNKSLLRRPVDIPTHEEDLQLITTAQTAKRFKTRLAARNELIVRHIPAIINYAGYFYRTHNSPRHVEVEDLVHVGVFGMAHAIKKFNRNKTVGRFISYARYWMRSYMHKAVNEYRMYTIPLSTRFAYERGRAVKPDTIQAIKHFRDITFIGENTKIYDRQLSPEDEAIFREELTRAGLT
jgi:RNA polymerase sigma factor (sigma-70 family)